MASTGLRTVRSFVRREGRMTPGQRRALEVLLPRYALEAGGSPFDFDAVYGRHAPVVCEIGFGNGEALAALAARQPERDFVGIEVHRPGVGSLLRKLATQNLVNVRVVIADAKEVLARAVLDGSLSAIHIFFPDPWPKKRHHKRRLVQPDFAALLRDKLVSGGYVHVATDWQDYAEHIRSVLLQTPGLAPAADSPIDPSDGRPLTRYEQRGRRLGHPVHDLRFIKA
jgi:tRNA (guanine-N7-)-methyltransferase